MFPYLYVLNRCSIDLSFPACSQGTKNANVTWLKCMGGVGWKADNNDFASFGRSTKFICCV